MAVGTDLKFDASVAKGLKLKVTKFYGLISTFVGATEEKMLGGLFWPLPSWKGLRNEKSIYKNTLIG